MRPFSSLAPFALTTFLLAACGDGGTGGAGGAGGSTSVCSADPRAQAFVVGLSQAAMDGKVEVTFVSAEPAPPAKGGNAFVVDVSDGGGQPIEGAAITVKPFMPDHGHAATLVPAVAPGGQPGRYQITNIDLFMPGIWEITFTVTPAGGAPDPVKFTFCVGG